MVILQDQISFIWQGIAWWMKEKNISPVEIAPKIGFSTENFVKGLKGEFVQLATDHLHLLVDYFGLRNARNRNFEDIADILTDEECIDLLTAPLMEQPRQHNLWD
jgi:hypothetical protein